MDDVYRDRQDPALTVWLPLEGGEYDGSRILIWTTTPWTLPANLAVAVGPDIDYAVMQDADGQRYVLAESRLGGVRQGVGRGDPDRHREGFGSGRQALRAAVRLLRRHPQCLPGARGADYVSTEDGTGVVHMAPGFGEDDQIACNAAGIPTMCPMDEHGRYTREIPEWVGLARVRCQPARDPQPQRPRRRGAPRLVRPLVPALLALRPAARVPGDLVVVRQGHRLPRSDGRTQSADHVGAGARQGRQFREMVGQRPRLVDQP